MPCPRALRRNSRRCSSNLTKSPVRGYSPRRYAPRWHRLRVPRVFLTHKLSSHGAFPGLAILDQFRSWYDAGASQGDLRCRFCQESVCRGARSNSDRIQALLTCAVRHRHEHTDHVPASGRSSRNFRLSASRIGKFVGLDCCPKYLLRSSAESAATSQQRPRPNPGQVYAAVVRRLCKSHSREGTILGKVRRR